MEDESIINQDDITLDDVSLEPGSNADSSEEILKYLSAGICELYDVYSYRHAAAILKNSFPVEIR